MKGSKKDVLGAGISDVNQNFAQTFPLLHAFICLAKDVSLCLLNLFWLCFVILALSKTKTCAQELFLLSSFC